MVLDKDTDLVINVNNKTTVQKAETIPHNSYSSPPKTHRCSTPVSLRLMLYAAATPLALRNALMASASYAFTTNDRLLAKAPTPGSNAMSVSKSTQSNAHGNNKQVRLTRCSC